MPTGTSRCLSSILAALSTAAAVGLGCVEDAGAPVVLPDTIFDSGIGPTDSAFRLRVVVTDLNLTERG